MGQTSTGGMAGEVPAHYCEFTFEIISSMITCWFAMDNMFIADEELSMILFGDHSDCIVCAHTLFLGRCRKCSPEDRNVYIRMLTNIQIEELCGRMNIPLQAIVFKDQLKDTGPLQYSRAYIVNMENEIGEDGKRNEGSHWVCFQKNKYPSSKTAAIYFDSMGSRPSQAVQQFLGETCPVILSTYSL